MLRTKRLFPALILTALAAGAAGFGASHFWENPAIQKLVAERDEARDCRRSGKTVRPCPVLYRNTRIEWRDRVRTVETADRKQSRRIARLSADLAQARLTIRHLQYLRNGDRMLRTAAVLTLQNGSMQHPYTRSDRCPAGTVVMYDAGLASAGVAARRSGDPGVCYVRARLRA
jgi:hypothetical protein